MLENKLKYLTGVYNKLLEDTELSQQFEILRQEKSNTFTQAYAIELTSLFAKIKTNNEFTPALIKTHLNSLKRSILSLPSNGLSTVQHKGKELSWIFWDASDSNTGFHIMSTYHGLILLAKLEGVIEHCISNVVCKNDEVFEEVTTPQGDRYINHKIGRKALSNRGDIECAYAYTKHANGSLTYSIVTLDDLKQASSRTYSWFWENEMKAMSCKTAVRQESKNWGDNIEQSSPSSLSALMNYEKDISSIEFSESPPKTSNTTEKNDKKEEVVVQRRSFSSYITSTEV